LRNRSCIIPGQSIPELGWPPRVVMRLRQLQPRSWPQGLAKFLKACSLNSRTIADEVIDFCCSAHGSYWRHFSDLTLVVGKVCLSGKTGSNRRAIRYPAFNVWCRGRNPQWLKPRLTSPLMYSPLVVPCAASRACGLQGVDWRVVIKKSPDLGGLLGFRTLRVIRLRHVFDVPHVPIPLVAALGRFARKSLRWSIPAAYPTRPRSVL
jgi:hypothetical protein